jgi:hypothetical protein
MHDCSTCPRFSARSAGVIIAPAALLSLGRIQIGACEAGLQKFLNGVRCFAGNRVDQLEWHVFFQHFGPAYALHEVGHLLMNIDAGDQE